MKQKTIKNKLSFSGIGIHSGVNVNVNLIPSSNNGIVFKRIDKKSNNIIKALYKNVVETNLGTVIGNGIEKVSTIEHLMSAIWSCDIDNLIVEIDNVEVPILDGSACNFISELEKVELIDLESEREYLIIDKEFIVEEGDKFIKIIPSDSFSVEMSVEYNYGSIGKQNYKFNGDKNLFKKEIAIARTFCHEDEIEWMRQHNLAKGGSLNNAMVFSNTMLLNTNGFRTEFEVAKHKIIDCVGDLFTSGRFIKGAIIANKTGHTLNNKFLRELLK